jgi:hypothetical protein
VPGLLSARRRTPWRRERLREAAPAPAVAVLARAQDARVVAGAVGVTLLRRHRSAAALALVWEEGTRVRGGLTGGAAPMPGEPAEATPASTSGAPGASGQHPPDAQAATRPGPRGSGSPAAHGSGSAAPRGSGSPAARRLAAALAARGHAASAAGRLAVVALPSDGQAAESAVRRLAAGPAECPVVLVLAGPRSQAADELLAEQDLVLVARRGEEDATVADLAVHALAARGLAVGSLPVPHGPARILAARGLAAPATTRRALTVALARLVPPIQEVS